MTGWSISRFPKIFRCVAHLKHSSTIDRDMRFPPHTIDHRSLLKFVPQRYLSYRDLTVWCKGVLLAESRQAAEAAIEKVKVQYTGVKKPIVNIDDAVAAGGAYAVAGTGRHGPTVKGDVDTAFAAAAHTAEGEVNILGQYHFRKIVTLSSICVLSVSLTRKV